MCLTLYVMIYVIYWKDFDQCLIHSYSLKVRIFHCVNHINWEPLKIHVEIKLSFLKLQYFWRFWKEQSFKENLNNTSKFKWSNKKGVVQICALIFGKEDDSDKGNADLLFQSCGNLYRQRNYLQRLIAFCSAYCRAINTSEVRRY